MSTTYTGDLLAPEGHAANEARVLERLDALARLLDTAVAVPGTRLRFGLDAALGVVPGIGDLVTAALSSYIVWEASRLGLPRWKIARMMMNVAADAAIGAVPLVGDVADVFFKANRRNIAILRDHLETRGPTRPVGSRRGPAGPVEEARFRVEPRR